MDCRSCTVERRHVPAEFLFLSNLNFNKKTRNAEEKDEKERKGKKCRDSVLRNDLLRDDVAIESFITVEIKNVSHR